MKYYFITYRATIRSEAPNYSIWNECIDISPMEFITDIEEMEKGASDNYYNFVVINTIEITEKEYKQFDLAF